MKITKYVHSCLLIEDQGKIALIDPGQFSYDSQIFDVNALQGLDYILITHEHTDHLSVPFVKALLARFPKVEIFSNAGVAAALAKDSISVKTEANGYFSFADAPHEKIFPGWPLPENSVFSVFGRITHPGDSLKFSQTTDILALPVQAPWGSTVACAEKAAELKPKYIIPIHDWHWHEQARVWSYQLLTKYFETQGIRFIAAENGKPIEL
jgi:L-ascorbate metabolism protein UlaG (beta-lactamase superfamily)